MGSPLLRRRQFLTYAGLGMAGLGSAMTYQALLARDAGIKSVQLPAASAIAQSSPANPKAATEKPDLPEFQGITQWLNSSPITIADLKGSVVLIQIWTFACINCQRTLPYTVRWHQQYASQGLKVVSIHTPEFGFERDINNVKQAVQKWGITYPVAIDNDFQMWKAYKNEYWPHLFLADRQGVIQYDRIGEGAYDTTEQTIQRLLG